MSAAMGGDWPRGSPGPRALEVDDGRERHRIERRAAHQDAVDFGLRHQDAGGVRLEAAAIKDAHGIRRLLAEFAAHLSADGAVGVGGDLRSEERRVGKEWRYRGAPGHSKI